MDGLENGQLPAFAGEAIRILALPGSLRQASFNRMLCEAASELAPAGVKIEVFDGMAEIPLFNEDVEAAAGYGPEPVRMLRRRIAAMDALLVATPEYNQSVPGVLKNVLDWLSRPGPEEVLVGKPVAVIGASGGSWGTRLAQKEVRHVLLATESLALPQPSLFVSNAANSFDDGGRLIDRVAREKLATLLVAFAGWIRRVGVPAPSEAPSSVL